jgi:hypothetical protein
LILSFIGIEIVEGDDGTFAVPDTLDEVVFK